MDSGSTLKPKRAANKLNKVCDAFFNAHGGNRYPIDIDQLAYGAAEIFKWKDPITEILGVDIPNFEGMLTSNDDRSKWMIAYNDQLPSDGRIRFTKAHELGHYILHRADQSEFRCSKEDMLKWHAEDDIEAQADTFASYLLMPLDDYRKQVNDIINLDVFSHCADRYGVSLTAVILKWLSYTDEKAILIMSRDGFMNWSSSSPAAMKSGAYFKTRKNVVPIPIGSLASQDTVETDRYGSKLPTTVWFPNADTNSELLEMKMFSAQYDCAITLLILPKLVDFWPPKSK